MTNALVNQVLDYSTRLPDNHTGVGIFNSRDATVNTDIGLIRGFCHIVRVNVFGGIRNSEFFKDDDDFPWVGAIVILS